MTGQAQCRDTKSPYLGPCDANSYVLAHVTAIQASLDAAITMVSYLSTVKGNMGEIGKRSIKDFN